MSDQPTNFPVPTLTIEAQVAAAVAKALPVLQAEMAKANAARSAAFHAAVARFGMKAVYYAFGFGTAVAIHIMLHGV